MAVTLVAPERRAEYDAEAAWRQDQQVYGLLTGQADWGSDIRLREDAQIDGTLTVVGGLINTGDLTLSARLIMAASAAKIVGGATSLSIRNAVDGADNLLVTNAGAVTVRNGLTVTAGGATVTAGGLTVAGGGLTVTAGGGSIAGGLTVSTGNLTVSSGTSSLGGAVTVTGGGLTVTAGGLTVDGGGLTVAGGGATISSGDLAVSSGTITASSTIQGTRLISTVATGTAPLTVASTTKVDNLNADFLDGFTSADFVTSLSGALLTDASSQTKAGALTIQGTFTTEGNTVVGSDVFDTLTVNAVGTFHAAQTFNNNVTAGNASTDTLTVVATATFDNGVTLGSSSADSLTVNAAAAFNGAATFQAAVIMNDAATLGSNSSDALTVNAVSTFHAAAAFNANVTLGDASGDALTVGATSTFNAPATFNGAATFNAVTLNSTIDHNGALIGFFGSTPTGKETITGVKTGTLAQLQTVVGNILSAGANYGLWNDSTT